MFKVGDEVIINNDEYSITRRGSMGKIVKVNDYQALVHFTILTSNHYGDHDHGQQDDHYFIPIMDLTLTKVADPQASVIAKIKEMEARRIKLKKTKVKSNDVPIAPYF